MDQGAGDELSGEVAIRASIDDTGLTIGGKSRALTAFDRLVGGVAGIPGAYFEGVRKRSEIREELRSEQLRIEGERLLDALRDGDEVTRVAARRLIRDGVRHQENREAVLVETIDALKALPPPESEAPERDADQLDEDWINIFARYAEDASSERLQALWGRILAGEIRKPGSFAPSTLRVISEMDATIAKAFEEVAAKRMSDGYIVKPKDLRNQELLKYNFLEEVGLLQGVQFGIQHKRTIDEGHDYSILQTKNYYIKLTPPEGVRKFGYAVVQITRAGQQIASILPWDEVGALKSCADAVQGNFEIELGAIRSRKGDLIHTQPIEILRSRT